MGIHTYDVSMKARLKAQALVFAALFTILKFAGNRVALRPRFHAYVTSVYLQAWPRICLLDDRQQIQQVVGAGSESWTVGFRVQRTDHSATLPSDKALLITTGWLVSVFYVPPLCLVGALVLNGFQSLKMNIYIKMSPLTPENQIQLKMNRSQNSNE